MNLGFAASKAHGEADDAAVHQKEEREPLADVVHECTTGRAPVRKKYLLGKFTAEWPLRSALEGRWGQG